jgi:hypothetical protein
MKDKKEIPVGDDVDYSVPEHSYLKQVITGILSGAIVVALIILVF